MAISRNCRPARARRCWGGGGSRSGRARSECWNSRGLRSHVAHLPRADRVPSRQTRARSGRRGRSGRRHLVHESSDGMGVDEIKSQSQGGRLAPPDGGCIQRREVGASTGAAVYLGGHEVICTADEDLRATALPGNLALRLPATSPPLEPMLVYEALSSHWQTDPAKFVMPLFAPRLIYSTATVRGWWLPRWASSQPLAEVRAAISDLLAMLSNGTLTPPAIVRYSVKDFQDAVRLADGEAGPQKVLLDFSEDRLLRKPRDREWPICL